MGFRGEALPSIGAVARLTLISRMTGGDAAEIKVDGGKVEGPRPAAFLASGQHGTRAEVRELFYATPARLKFLKSARSEDLAIVDIVKRLAMARPDIGFHLTLDGRKALDLEAEPDLMDGRLPRLARIMGRGATAASPAVASPVAATPAVAPAAPSPSTPAVAVASASASAPAAKPAAKPAKKAAPKASDEASCGAGTCAGDAKKKIL